MEKIIEGNYVNDIVKYEVQEYSREVVSIKNGAGNLKAGTVLEMSSDGYIPLTYNSNKLGIPACVLIKDVDATKYKQNGIVIIRHGIVAENKLIFNFTEKKAIKEAIDGLKAIGIIARKGE